MSMHDGTAWRKVVEIREEPDPVLDARKLIIGLLLADDDDVLAAPDWAAQVSLIDDLGQLWVGMHLGESRGRRGHWVREFVIERA